MKIIRSIVVSICFNLFSNVGVFFHKYISPSLVPQVHEVVVEVGGGVGGGTDGHLGEGDVTDGQGLQGRGHRVLGPILKTLQDDHEGRAEARYDRTHPEHSDMSPGGGNISQTVDGGGF